MRLSPLKSKKEIMSENISDIVKQTYRRAIWRIALFALSVLIVMAASVFALVAAYTALVPLYGETIAALLIAGALFTIVIVISFAIMIDNMVHQREVEQRKQSLGAVALIPMIGSLVGLVGPVRVLKSGAFVTKHVVRHLPLLIAVGGALFAASRYAKYAKDGGDKA